MPCLQFTSSRIHDGQGIAERPIEVAKVMEMNKERCVQCNRQIDSRSKSFEQRLVGDEDFCRTCWDEIMDLGVEEVLLPTLIVEAA